MQLCIKYAQPLSHNVSGVEYNIGTIIIDFEVPFYMDLHTLCPV